MYTPCCDWCKLDDEAGPIGVVEPAIFMGIDCCETLLSSPSVFYLNGKKLKIKKFQKTVILKNNLP